MSEVVMPSTESVNDVAELEELQKAYKMQIERRDMALRLYNNPDFRKLIVDGFMLHDAARYAQESADPSLDEQSRADALAMAQASGHLKRFLSFQCRMGDTAQKNLIDLDDELAEARAEQGAE